MALSPKIRFTTAIAALAAAGTLVFSSDGYTETALCTGEGVPARTVIDKSSIDALSEKCFDGHRIKDLIPDRLAWRIREHNAFLRIIPDAPLPLPYRLVEATERYKGQPQLNPDTQELLNYNAGVPFPAIDPGDPQAAVKIIWNQFYARPDQWGSPGNYTGANFVFLLVDGDRGIERVQHWNFSAYRMRGRITGTQETLDPKVYNKAVLFAVTPQDIKGLGTFTITYHTPQLPDVWAYIRTVRRVRRLSGGAWVDPIGGTDQLQDDILGFNAHPNWYANFKLLGKTKVFAVADSGRGIEPFSARVSFDAKATTLETQNRMVVFEPPYWNFDDVWMPREVYVIEAVPPEYHPYSRKVLYYDAENWHFFYGEFYDRKGDFWKWNQFSPTSMGTADGFVDPRTGKPEIYHWTNWGETIDFQRRHATLITQGGEFYMNTVNTSANDFTLATLEAAGR